MKKAFQNRQIAVVQNCTKKLSMLLTILVSKKKLIKEIKI